MPLHVMHKMGRAGGMMGRSLLCVVGVLPALAPLHGLQEAVNTMQLPGELEALQQSYGRSEKPIRRLTPGHWCRHVLELVCGAHSHGTCMQCCTSTL